MSLPSTVVEVACVQGTPAWLAERVGLLTGSRCAPILAAGKGGAPSAGQETLLTELVVEAVTGKPVEKSWTPTAAMDAGTEREPLAFDRFRVEKQEVLQTSGFLRHTQLRVGCSLDGHLGDYDELVSIKCRQPKAHYAHLRTNDIPKDARVQMAHELWVTGAQTHHYVSFNPDFPTALQFHCVTLTRAQLDVDGYAKAALAFLARLDTEIAAMHTLAAGWQLAGVSK